MGRGEGARVLSRVRGVGVGQRRHGGGGESPPAGLRLRPPQAPAAAAAAAPSCCYYSPAPRRRRSLYTAHEPCGVAWTTNNLRKRKRPHTQRHGTHPTPLPHTNAPCADMASEEKRTSARAARPTAPLADPPAGRRGHSAPSAAHWCARAPSCCCPSEVTAVMLRFMLLLLLLLVPLAEAAAAQSVLCACC